jgi:hypothetical protein
LLTDGVDNCRSLMGAQPRTSRGGDRKPPMERTSTTMRYNGFVSLAAASVITITAVLVLPADARTKKKQKQYRGSTTSLSLDGRNTGRARTCGHETFVYDGWGVPMGPYCH